MNNPVHSQDSLKQDSSAPAPGARAVHSPQLNHVIEMLHENYSFFADMLDDEIAEFLAMCKQISFQGGQRIFSEGDIADNFFLVLSGEVSISIGGNEVSILRAGQIFGEMALLEHIPRTATATALAGEKTALFAIPAEVVCTMMPSLALKLVINIARQMSEKIRESNAHTHF